MVTDLLDARAYGRVVSYLSTKEEEVVYAKKAGEPNANDYQKVQRIRGGKLVDEVKEIKLGNIKEALRHIKMGAPLSKVMALNDDLQEYLFYCLIYAQTAAGGVL